MSNYLCKHKYTHSQQKHKKGNVYCVMTFWLLTLSTPGHWGNWYEATKLLGGSMVFQEATSEPTGKAKKLTSQHLMPHNKHLGK
jgi:hypothetical protein